MKDESAAGLPAAVGQATFEAELDRLRAREKAHTREGGAIAEEHEAGYSDDLTGAARSS